MTPQRRPAGGSGAAGRVAGPAAYRAALGVAAGVVVVRAVLLGLDGLDRLQDVGLGDPVWPALGVLLALLVAPYVSEVEAAGAKVRRWEPPTARDGSDELAELAAGSADALPALSPDEEVELAASRYVGVQLAFTGAVGLYPELAGCRLHLYVPDETGRLVPVLEHDDADVAWQHGWDPGDGVVGRAFARRRGQVSRAPDLQHEVAAVPGKPAAAFEDLSLVVAVPLLNLAGRPVGVLSAASDTDVDDEQLAELQVALQAMAGGLARVLVDLAAWDTDDPGTDAGAPEHAGG